MAIKLDRSTSGIVIHCTDCPWWRAFRFHKSDAWDVAIRHEEDVHPEDNHQRTAQRVRNHRLVSGM